jgi:hypothetical protein
VVELGVPEDGVELVAGAGVEAEALEALSLEVDGDLVSDAAGFVAASEVEVDSDALLLEA